MASDRPDVCVFAPALFTTVTIEIGTGDADEIHLHPGGQGFWVARMIKELGRRPILCGPVGGETGRVIRGLIPEWGIDLSPVTIEADSPAYVHDRRGGERVEVAHSPPPVLDRHEVDDLYGKVMQHSIAAGVCVLTGRASADILPVDLFRRLGADLGAAGVRIVGDLHGRELDALLEGGRIDVLKVSDEDLREDGKIHDASDENVVATLGALREAGADAVVISRGEDPALACFDHTIFQVTPPTLEVVDYRGAGDSMTAALAVAAAGREDPETALRLASASGAASVTRHGLGSGSKELIDRLMDLVEVEEWVG